jgi:hypothetical protein
MFFLLLGNFLLDEKDNETHKSTHFGPIEHLGFKSSLDVMKWFVVMNSTLTTLIVGYKNTNAIKKRRCWDESKLMNYFSPW